jgi:hypothetical protein
VCQWGAYLLRWLGSWLLASFQNAAAAQVPVLQNVRFPKARNPYIYHPLSYIPFGGCAARCLWQGGKPRGEGMGKPAAPFLVLP